jgi:hypothetical protein
MVDCQAGFGGWVGDVKPGSRDCLALSQKEFLIGSKLFEYISCI